MKCRINPTLTAFLNSQDQHLIYLKSFSGFGIGFFEENNC